MNGKEHRPESLAHVLKTFLADSGLKARIEQSEVVPEWRTLVGDRIASVTEPLFVTANATLFVAVHTHAWMTELQLMAPEILRALNSRADRPPVLKLRFQLLRERHPDREKLR